MKSKLKDFPVNHYIDIALLIFLIFFPLFVKTFRVEMMSRYLCFAIFALSLDLLWGYTGLLSLGHAVLFGMGGYMIGICYQIQNGLPAFMTREGLTQIPWFYIPLKNPIAAAAIGILIPALFAMLLGFFMFSSKIKGVFFTIITLALAQIFSEFIINVQKYTNGFNGLQGVKRFAINGGEQLGKVQYYYIVLAIAVLVFIFCLWLSRSRIGKIATSIRENEARLGFFGYQSSHYKILIYTISGALAGLAGVLYTPATSSITTQDIGVAASTAVVVWIAVGGRGNLTGAVFGALFINWAQSLLSEHFSSYWQLILGGVLLAIIFFIPNGIIGQIIELQRRRTVEGVKIKEQSNANKGAGLWRQIFSR
ncbi:MAG: urea ABC transporter permease subunit UrtC [Clostridia bacterium]|jgi:urea transport system permease protein|nr:urea ABC transporter permease subunit UrtC [Clostridia bacterium]MCI1999665.1 urea ABC transporter permease subunit UrtC [Clostridia bacterium]MCI2013956.1 urea ABC transporter permease subunit UrtC [Clostridia bacterium]